LKGSPIHPHSRCTLGTCLESGGCIHRWLTEGQWPLEAQSPEDRELRGEARSSGLAESLLALGGDQLGLLAGEVLVGLRVSALGEVEGLIGDAGLPEKEEEDGELAGEGDGGAAFLARVVGAREAKAKATEVRVLTEGTHDVVGALDEELASVTVTSLGDGHLRGPGTGGPETRDETEVGGDITAIREAMGIANDESEGEGSERADALYLAEGGSGGVALVEALDVLIESPDLGSDLGDHVDERADGRKEFLGDEVLGVLVERMAIGGWKLGAIEALQRAADGVDEKGASTDEGSATANETEIGLLGRGTLIDAAEEFVAAGTEEGESTSIVSIGLAQALGDEANLIGIDDDDVIADFQELAGDPVGVGAGLENEA